MNKAFRRRSYTHDNDQRFILLPPQDAENTLNPTCRNASPFVNFIKGQQAEAEATVENDSAPGIISSQQVQLNRPAAVPALDSLKHALRDRHEQTTRQATLDRIWR